MSFLWASAALKSEAGNKAVLLGFFSWSYCEIKEKKWWNFCDEIFLQYRSEKFQEVVKWLIKSVVNNYGGL